MSFQIPFISAVLYVKLIKKKLSKNNSITQWLRSDVLFDVDNTDKLKYTASKNKTKQPNDSN